MDFEEIIKTIAIWLFIDWLIISEVYELDEQAYFTNIELYNKHTINLEHSRFKKKYYSFLKKNKKSKMLKLSFYIENLLWIANIVGIVFCVICTVLGIQYSLFWLLYIAIILFVILEIGTYFYVWRFSNGHIFEMDDEENKFHIRKKTCHHRIKASLWNIQLKSVYMHHLTKKHKCEEYLSNSKMILQWLNNEKDTIWDLIQKKDCITSAKNIAAQQLDDSLFYENLVPVHGNIVFLNPSHWYMQLAIYCKHKDYLNNSYIRIDITDYQVVDASICFYNSFK